jgi:hypothetical protein
VGRDTEEIAGAQSLSLDPDAQTFYKPSMCKLVIYMPLLRLVQTAMQRTKAKQVLKPQFAETSCFDLLLKQ